MLLICLGQTFYCHTLCMKQKDSLAVAIDRRVIRFLGLGLYPLATVGLFMAAVEWTVASALFLGLGARAGHLCCS